jgi:DMSO/TMAO reductase YedYZ molybdopterin-dependent catalytic subunit
MSPEKRLEVGLDIKTWQLEVVADPQSDAQIENPMTKQQGNALDWDGLMRLAKTRAVRFMKVMTCTNIGQPLGMGLWEGVPLRDVIWMARPATNVRRVFYYGYHNDVPDQRFQSSLPMGRVCEDPPGEHPVILCYKLNNQWLLPENGAPVRVVVPDAYGNKSVKWLQRIVLTNAFKANDTYAEWNNDTESHSKTFARFIHVPTEVRTGEPVPITGVAQVGMSGLSRVQVWLQREDEPVPENDPHFTQVAWQDAQCLPPPENWGGGLPGGRLPPVPRQIDPQTGKPLTWPIRDTIVHWATLLTDLPAGIHTLRCRTVDANGVAQPMPRPFPKSGANQIESRSLTVKG